MQNLKIKFILLFENLIFTRGENVNRIIKKKKEKIKKKKLKKKKNTMNSNNEKDILDLNDLHY